MNRRETNSQMELTVYNGLIIPSTVEIAPTSSNGGSTEEDLTYKLICYTQNPEGGSVLLRMRKSLLLAQCPILSQINTSVAEGRTVSVKGSVYTEENQSTAAAPISIDVNIIDIGGDPVPIPEDLRERLNLPSLTSSEENQEVEKLDGDNPDIPEYFIRPQEADDNEDDQLKSLSLVEETQLSQDEVTVQTTNNASTTSVESIPEEHYYIETRYQDEVCDEEGINEENILTKIDRIEEEISNVQKALEKDDENAATSEADIMHEETQVENVHREEGSKENENENEKETVPGEKIPEEDIEMDIQEEQVRKGVAQINIQEVDNQQITDQDHIPIYVDSEPTLQQDSNINQENLDGERQADGVTAEGDGQAPTQTANLDAEHQKDVSSTLIQVQEKHPSPLLKESNNSVSLQLHGNTRIIQDDASSSLIQEEASKEDGVQQQQQEQEDTNNLHSQIAQGEDGTEQVCSPKVIESQPVQPRRGSRLRSQEPISIDGGIDDVMLDNAVRTNISSLSPPMLHNNFLQAEQLPTEEQPTTSTPNQEADGDAHISKRRKIPHIADPSTSSQQQPPFPPTPSEQQLTRKRGRRKKQKEPVIIGPIFLRRSPRLAAKRRPQYFPPSRRKSKKHKET